MNFQMLRKWFRRQRVKGPAAEACPTPALPKDTPLAGTGGGESDRAESPATAKRCRKVHKTAIRQTGQRTFSRQGIPILKPDEDLSAHFVDAPAEKARSDPANGETGGSPDRKAGSGGGAGRFSSASPAKAVRRNRLGIRHLDADDDLHAHFTAPDVDEPPEREQQTSAAAGRTPADRDPPIDIPTDRHGIPRLDNQADLKRLFNAAVDESESGEALGETLRQSLAHDARGLMKKKTGGFFPPRRLTLKERLRRYPAPQAELDLHGRTASEARQRAEAFIHTACADGLYTLRIIVGKGLHSEGGAVLPNVIEDLLVVLKREDLVLSYRWEKGIKRKSGAVIVFLAVDLR